MNGIRLVIAFAIGLGFAGCAHRDYDFGGRKFQTYEEARAYARTFDDQLIAAAQPLPAPIAGPAVAISPTRAQWEDAMRRVFPSKDDQFIREMASLYGEQPSIRAIERRNIFESVRHIKAESPEGTPVPPHGYLIWYGMQIVPSGYHVEIYMAASGEAQQTNLSIGSRPVASEKEATARLLQEVENYVRAHPAVR